MNTKLLSIKWFGDLVLILIFSLITLFLLKGLVFDGATLFTIIPILLAIIAIAIIVRKSSIENEPTISTTQGIIYLGIGILLFGGSYAINLVYGSLWSFLYFFGLLILIVWIHPTLPLLDWDRCSGISLLGNNSNQNTATWDTPSRDSEDSRYISAEVKAIVWKRDGGKCVKCGSKKHLEWDHDIPFSQGGSNTENNIRILCKECNRRKSDKIE